MRKFINGASLNPRHHPVFLAVIAYFALSVMLSFGAPMEGMESSYKQPDGTVITLKFFGDEFYARTETADGYTVIFDQATKTYYYAQLSSDGNDFVSTGKQAGKVDPSTLGINKSIKLNPAARAEKARKNYEEHESIVKQEERWTAVKEASRKYREFNKKVKEQEKAGKKGFVIPMGTIFPDTEIPSDISMAPPAEGDGVQAEEPPSLAPPSFTLSGNVVGLTILVDFSDVPGTAVTQAEVDDYCNKPGFTGWSNKGSLYDYFYAQSATRLRYNNNVTYYVRVPQPKTYYNNTATDCGTCGRLLLNDALNVLIADGYDFSQLTTKVVSGKDYVRACNVLFAGDDSGVWSYGLWPHRSSISAKNVGGNMYIYDYQITEIGTSGGLTIGTVCHENGHMLLGYPDFYDYEGDSAGMGKYTLMASGNHYYQTCPINIHGYLKWHSGWLDEIELYGASKPVRCSVRVDGDTIYKYTNPGASTEYFMIENRSKLGWELNSGIPDSGIMITHNDEAGGRDREERTEAEHYECSVEQADGLFELETNTDSGDSSDFFHSGGTGPATNFTDTTLPNAKWWAGADGTASSGTASGLEIHSISAAAETMTFVYGAGTPSGSAKIGLDASTINTICNYRENADTEKFGIFNAGGGTLNYTISDNQSWLSCSPTSGTATAESDAISVVFTTTGLVAGAYSATITVIDPSASPTTNALTVSLTVNAQPAMSLSHASITESGIAGSNGPTVEVSLDNTGGGEMTYTVTKSQTWLTVTPASGTVMSETDTIYVDLDSSLLAPGTYNDTITITSPEASNSPKTIPVTFEVNGDDVIVSSPNGGEEYYTGNQLGIAWVSSIGGNVSINLMKGGSLDTVITSSTTNDGSHSWTIPSTKVGTNFTIRITSLDANPGFSDESNGDFSFYLPPLIDEDFEGPLSLPSGWSQQTVSGGATWKVQNGGGASGGSNPSAANSGTNNMTLYLANTGDNKTRLKTPAFDCSSYGNLVVRFWHTQAMWSPDQDYLTVYYSTNGGTSWTHLAGYSNSITSWTERELSLPSASANAVIAFEGNAKYGYGVCVDDVLVLGDFAGASVIVTKSGGSVDVTEGGTNDTYTLVLSKAPTASVIVSISNDVEVSVSTNTVTFTTGNWSTPREITVTAVNDSDHELSHFGTISHSASSSDSSFNGIAIDSVIASITDNDNNAPSVNAGPDQNVTLTGGAWSPTEANPSLWLDADDASTVLLNGSTVSNWVDKSGNGRNATQAVAGSQPTDTAAGLDGKHVLTFDGTTDYFNVNLDFLAGVSHSAFIVTKPTAYTDIYGAANASAGANSLHVGFNGVSTQYRMNYWGNDWYGTVSTNFHAGNGNILNYVWTSGSNKEIFANGNSEGTAGSAGVIGTMSGGGRIGQVVNHGYYGGAVAEIIMVTGTVSQVTRQTFEGYLAHKWGIETWLPSAHPYKTASPNNAAAEATLNGTVSDLDSDPFSTLWTKISGPGTVTFDNANAVDTIARFTTEGVYLLKLSASDGATQTVDVVQITVNSPAAGVIVSQSSGNTAVAEGGATDSYTIKLQSEPKTNVTVNIATNAQVSMNPASLVFTAVNWSNAQTVVVTAIDDAIYEGSHTGTITHTVSSSDTNYNGIAVENVTVTVSDNDAPGVISLKFASYNISENAGTLSVDVTRTDGSVGAFSVDILTSNGTAVAGTDYTAKTQTLTWANGNADTKTFSVNITDNSSYSGDRAFYVKLTNAVGSASLLTTSATVTILEDEPEPIGARVTAQSPLADVAQAPGVSQITLSFSMAIATNSFSLDEDVVSFTGARGVDLRDTLTGYSWANGNTELTITFGPIIANSSCRLVIGPDILTLNSFPMDQDNDSNLGENEEDTYAANILVQSTGSDISLWSDLKDTDDVPGPGWTLDASYWEFGAPAEDGKTGPNAGTDAGTNILAQNLAGDYTGANTNTFAETPDIDATDYAAVFLDYQAWTGRGKNDTFYVDVGYGSTWNRVYTNTNNKAVNDEAWISKNLNISAYATGKVFRVRFGLIDTTAAGSGVGTGWQLDAIRVSGDLASVLPPPPVVVSHSPTGAIEDAVSSLYASFSQPMDTTSFALGDIASFSGPSTPITASGFSWITNTLLRIDFPEQSAQGTYTIVLNPSILDKWGQSLDQDKDGNGNEAGQDQYTGSFTINSSSITTNHSVPHSWLQAQNQSWTNDFEYAATNDADGDGFSTAEEYWSGTDPTNKESHLKIEGILQTSTNVQLIWSHAQIAGGIPPISIQSRTSMSTGIWTYAGQVTPVNGTNTWNYLLPDNGFFRLCVTNMP